jgi:hypothetical protein
VREKKSEKGRERGRERGRREREGKRGKEREREGKRGKERERERAERDKVREREDLDFLWAVECDALCVLDDHTIRVPFVLRLSAARPRHKHQTEGGGSRKGRKTGREGEREGERERVSTGERASVLFLHQASSREDCVFSLRGQPNLLAHDAGKSSRRRRVTVK